MIFLVMFLKALTNLVHDGAEQTATPCEPPSKREACALDARVVPDLLKRFVAASQRGAAPRAIDVFLVGLK